MTYKKSITPSDLKALADAYAHCFAFVDDGAIRAARERLHIAIDDAMRAVAERAEELERQTRVNIQIRNHSNAKTLTSSIGDRYKEIELQRDGLNETRENPPGFSRGEV